jgi:predicted tellurium resistance membrane protein TerC
MITRIILLFSLTWLMRLTDPLFTVFSHGISGRDLILMAGGLFLLAKATLEIHDKLEGQESHSPQQRTTSFAGVLIQIMLLDIVFSFDSVITAIGMANLVIIMVLAVILAVIFMMFSSGRIGGFVEQHPTVKILALSFLLLIGVALITDGLGLHIPKGYIYFAMAFSVFVETINLRVRKKEVPPIKLRKSFSVRQIAETSHRQSP